MNEERLKQFLEKYKRGDVTNDQVIKEIRKSTIQDLGFANIDTHREVRTGYPEIIFCQGKTTEQVKLIFQSMLESENTNILGTRATPEMHEAVKEISPEAEYHPLGRTLAIKQKVMEETKTYISVVTAGTSDIPVAEEAAITAEMFGNKVERIFDVGVAGIHRLYRRLDLIRGSRVIVVIAGMEGALPSVVGGLVDKPVIAVPTSIGYGANFGGLSALLGMLTSCAAGTGVVNIDNGFGAGYLAGMINKL